ncbi:alpha-keto acid decarboxylase family protein [Acinetobacter stercoris]|uniref:Indole-3-pyruvate decarboxylase n=1 Tax=Acinetobacter stercoris TaxID=2126983 RepID=A0A2U3N2J6_9GAMM|nr:thiamine pyrophosphate-binding protein [Acinetobacter stercoris]SPL71917.1 Indole-3-pyruvate decarboxylase [Acinetobacter stercoris]
MLIEIGRYLNKRLQQLGIYHIFGVPGDFNLSYLEQVEAEQDLEFVGNCNELNAAYAADGYARINGFSALATTYGVGDLSAINGIAGAYTENVAVVHISGIPPLHAVKQGALLHHTLVDGNYDNIMNCMKEFTVAQTRLTPANAASEIDRVLRQCFIERRPVHIQLPSDITHIKIEVNEQPLNLIQPKSDPELLDDAVNKIVKAIAKAERPALLIDNEAQIFNVTDLLMDLAQKCSIPFATLCTAKNIMDESSPLFAGVYVGVASQPSVKNLIENSDCLIGIGPRFTDVGSAYFTHNIQPEHFIEIKQYDVNIFNQNFPGIDITELLTQIMEQVAIRKVSKPTLEPTEKKVEQFASSRKLSHDILWKYVSQFLKEDDVIIGEVGTSNTALSGIRLPTTAKYIAQPIWGSIGYTLPALLGSMFAAPKRRHVLFIGDGSIQLTMQELSTIIRHDLKPVIFVLNNGGYTIERLILGENSTYNDIQNWKYTEMINVFNGKGAYDTFVVETAGELQNTLDKVSNYDGLALIELKLPAMDAPLALQKFADVVARYDYGDLAYRKLKTPPQFAPCKDAI